MLPISDETRLENRGQPCRLEQVGSIPTRGTISAETVTAPIPLATCTVATHGGSDGGIDRTNFMSEPKTEVPIIWKNKPTVDGWYWLSDPEYTPRIVFFRKECVWKSDFYNSWNKRTTQWAGPIIIDPPTNTGPTISRPEGVPGHWIKVSATVFGGVQDRIVAWEPVVEAKVDTDCGREYWVNVGPTRFVDCDTKKVFAIMVKDATFHSYWLNPDYLRRNEEAAHE